MRVAWIAYKWFAVRQMGLIVTAFFLASGTVACGMQPGGGQRADPDFNTKVARPAYDGDRHPALLIDEAHNNFHTASGRYKVFAELIGSDGYRVAANRQEFSAAGLKDCAVLVIANAVSDSDKTESAFTDAECQAVRDWVEAGGSLLLITDHAPFGAAAAQLGWELGEGEECHRWHSSPDSWPTQLSAR